MRHAGSAVRSLILVLLTLSQPGCAALAGREATVTCQVADTATSVYAVKHGAVERGLFLNGASAGYILGFGIFWMGVKLLLHDHVDETNRAILNGVACAAGAYNFTVIQRLP